MVNPQMVMYEEEFNQIQAVVDRLVREANAKVVFIVDKNGHFYFIEVNARIQVEHPVTEMVTGIDLIKWQIRVAAGERLPWAQADIRQLGAAIECRINAENPRRNFQPSPGKITSLIAPGGFGVRFDSHAHSGYTVPANYDSMIGKLIVHQPTRAEAIACMQRALAEMRVEGIHTTAEMLAELLDEEWFVRGDFHTTTLEEWQS